MNWLKFFSLPVQNWNNFQFCEVATTNFFPSPLLMLLLDPGSEIRDPRCFTHQRQWRKTSVSLIWPWRRQSPMYCTQRDSDCTWLAQMLSSNRTPTIGSWTVFCAISIQTQDHKMGYLIGKKENLIEIQALHPQLSLKRRCCSTDLTQISFVKNWFLTSSKRLIVF